MKHFSVDDPVSSLQLLKSTDVVLIRMQRAGAPGSLNHSIRSQDTHGYFPSGAEKPTRGHKLSHRVGPEVKGKSPAVGFRLSYHTTLILADLTTAERAYYIVDGTNHPPAVSQRRQSN